MHQARNARIGLRLFALYLACYAAFVGACAFAPDAMEAAPVAGVTLAVTWGLGLIALAMLLAMVYGMAAKDAPEAAAAEE